MQRKARVVCAAMAGLMLAPIALWPTAARASEEGRRNTTLGLGALTAYLFTRGGSKVPAFVGAAATAYAYKRYDDSIRARHRREQWYRRYHRRYSRHHRR